MATKYFVTTETIFCDYESDLEIRRRYLSRWLHSLASVATLTIPADVTFRHYLYVSRDKVTELNEIREFIKSLPADQQDRFQLVAYDHPESGYGYDAHSHPDHFKNPNKSAPNRDILFEKALKLGQVPDWERIVRLTLDDDDLWLPWHLEEVIKAADKAYEPGKIIGVGLENAILAYIDAGSGDIVGLTKAMNGNKFYVSDRTSWNSQIKLSPWSIPETFDEDSARRLARAGVELKWIKGNKPGWVYGRWGDNLSSREKNRYYSLLVDTFSFSDINDIGRYAGITEQKADLLARTISTSAETTDDRSLQAYIPPTFLQGQGQIYAVFRTPNGSNQEVFRLRRGEAVPLPMSKFFNGTSDWIAHLQLRPPTGPRTEVSTRARLSSLNPLAKLAPSDLLSDVNNYSERDLTTLRSGFLLSGWLHRSDVVANIQELITAGNVSTWIKPTSHFDRSLTSYLLELPKEVPGSLTHSALDYISAGATFASSLQFAQPNRVSTKQCSGASVPTSPIQYEVDATEGLPLLVFFHGRKSPNVKLPYLVGKGLSSGHSVSRLSISDPSLDFSAENTIGWFAGNISHPNLQDDIAALVTKVAEDYKASRIVFVGGSAGGFASLVLASYFPESIALVWNPQTDIFKYYRKFVDFYIDSCWQGQPELLRRHSVTSVVGHTRDEGGEPLVLYMQEPTDNHHVDSHMRPFLAAAPSPDNILVYNSHWGDGHVPPPKDLLHSVVDIAIAPDVVTAALEAGFTKYSNNWPIKQ